MAQFKNRSQSHSFLDKNGLFLAFPEFKAILFIEPLANVLKSTYL